MDSLGNSVSTFADKVSDGTHVKLLLRFLVPNMGLGLVACFLVYLLLGPVAISTQLLNAWLLAQVVTTLIRLGLSIHNPHWIAPPHLSPRRCTTRHAFFAAVTGILWGSAFFLLTPGAEQTTELLLAAVIATISILVTTSYFVHPAIKAALLFPMLVLISLWSLTAMQAPYLWIAAALPVLMVVLVLLVFRRHKNYSTVIGLQLQNALLERDYRLGKSLLARQQIKFQAQESIEHSDLQLFRSGPVVIYSYYVRDGQRVIHRVSENIRNYGYEAEALEGIAWDNLMHVDDGLQQKEFRLRCADGSFKWVYDFSAPNIDENDSNRVFNGYFIDVTRLRTAHDELAREKERAQVTLDSIGDAVITTDPAGIISFMNPAAEILTACRESEMRGKPLNSVLHIRQTGTSIWIDDPLNYYLGQDDGSAREHLKVEYRSQIGEHGLLTYKASAIRNSGPQVYGYVLVLVDVTHTEELQDELEFQARHDDLTGIYNRWEFENRFRMLLDARYQGGAEHILLYLDLDQFKLVNDTCGHHAGDELLRQLTAAYGATLDNNAIFARLGGDEFGVLLDSCGTAEGLRIAAALRDMTRDFAFSWDTRIFQVGVSIGVVPFGGENASIHDLLGAADVACYAAKEQGRNHIRLHRDSDADLLQRRKDMDWAGRLTDSMANGEFKLYYQEIVAVNNPQQETAKRIEILLRLHKDSGETLSADTFLPSAERYNLMPELDRWVVRESFAWYRQQGKNMNVLMNINLSGLSFTNPGFLEFLEGLFNQYKVPPSAVCFEVTETAAIQNLATARQFIQQLRVKGCSFALDDFGSGVSSFEYLKALPVDYVKIDGKFVTDISINEVDRAVVGAINDVGHTMKLKTIAEYVENDEILNELHQMKVDFAQGYGVGRPQPLETLCDEQYIG